MRNPYLGHNLKGIVVVLDSFLVEIVAIGFHMAAFLEVASHLGRPVVVEADTYVAMVALDNLVVDFCWTKNIQDSIRINCCTKIKQKSKRFARTFFRRNP